MKRTLAEEIKLCGVIAEEIVISRARYQYRKEIERELKRLLNKDKMRSYMKARYHAKKEAK